MAPAFLIIGLIAVPVVVGGCFAYAIYQSYRRRRVPLHDVERARNLEYTQRNQREGIELGPIKIPDRVYYSSHRYGPRNVVSPNDAPIAPPHVKQPVQITGGEGLVSYAEHYLPTKAKNVKGKGRAQDFNGLREQQPDTTHATQPWEWGGGKLEQPGLYQHGDVIIASPKPVRAVISRANERFVTAPYNTRVDMSAEASSHDNQCTAQGTVPVASSSRSVHAINIDDGAFEEINLDHDDHSAAWTQTATPAVTITEEKQHLDVRHEFPIEPQTSSFNIERSQDWTTNWTEQVAEAEARYAGDPLPNITSPSVLGNKHESGEPMNQAIQSGTDNELPPRPIERGNTSTAERTRYPEVSGEIQIERSNTYAGQAPGIEVQRPGSKGSRGKDDMRRNSLDKARTESQRRSWGSARSWEAVVRT